MAEQSSTALTRRKVLTATAGIGVAVPLASFLGGCSAGSGGSGKTLRVSWWGSVDRAKKFDKIFELYMHSHKGTTVKGEYADFNPYWSRFATEASGRTLPSVVGMTEREVNAYNKNLADFKPYVSDKRIDLSSYPKQYIDAGMVDGKLSMICSGWTIPALAYNAALCKSAGVNHVPLSWSFSEFQSAAIKISKAGGGKRWGCADEGGNPLAMATFMLQRGKTMFTDKGMGIDAADWAAWLQLWQDLRKAKAIPPAQVTVEQAGVPFQDTLLAKGQVAMDWINHNQIQTIQPYVKSGDLDVVMQPVTDGGKPIALLAGTYFSMPKTTSNPDEAASFINFFLNNSGAIKAYDADLGALPSSHGTAVLQPTLNAVSKRCAKFFSAARRYGVVSRPRNPGAVQAESLITNANQDVGLGRETPDSAGKKYYEQALQLMNAS